MAAIYSAVQGAATKFLTAMVQKQLENVMTKVRVGANETIFGNRLEIVDIPLGQVKKDFDPPKILDFQRSLNEKQKKRLEEKQERKRQRLEEIRQKKNIVDTAANEVLYQAKETLDILEEQVLTMAKNITEQVLSSVSDATELAKGLFESYKKLFSDLGTHGDGVLTGTADLMKTMLAAPTAIIGACAWGPTITPGALAQFIFSVKTKSSYLGAELSKFKSALGELRGTIQGIGEFPGKEELESTLDVIDTMTIGPESLIMATGGLVYLIDADLNDAMTSALEGVLGDMAGPIMALATNDATLCDSWSIKESIKVNLTYDEIIDLEADFSRHSWDNCGNFSPMTFKYRSTYILDPEGNPIPKLNNKGEQEVDELGNPIYIEELILDEQGKPMIQYDNLGNPVPSEKSCKNCKNYKKK